MTGLLYPVDGIEFLADAGAKGMVILMVAGLAILALRRGSAAARHVIWSAALIGLLLLPVVSTVLPGWHMQLPACFRHAASPAAAALGATLAEPVAELPPSSDAAVNAILLRGGAGNPRVDPVMVTASVGEEGTAPPAERTQSLPGENWLLLVWVAGTMLTALPLAAGWLSLWRLRASCRRVTSGPLADRLRELARGLGIRRPVLLLLSDRRTMPMTWGVWRPVLLLPGEAERWPSERLHVVLLHELAHVKRRDCLTQPLAHLARALHWFNPLAWLAAARLRVEQERACDDLVLAAGHRASDYAEHLLTVTAGLPPRFFTAPVALAMSTSSKLEGRVLSILDPKRNRRPLTRRLASLAALAGLCMLLPLASLRLQPAAVAEPAAGLVESPAADASADQSVDPAKKVADAQAKIREHYIKKPDEKAISEGAIKGMVEALHDPYSEYFPADRLAELNRQMQGTLTGIGAQLRMKDGKPVVVTPLEDSPALKAGLRPGDEIVAIDGKPVKGLDLAEVVKRIIGPQGSAVKLKIAREGGEEKELAITRAQLKLATIQGFRRGEGGRWSYILTPEPRIVYVRVLQFNQGTSKEVRDAFTPSKAKGLILDLRFCPGGLLSAAGDVTKLFLAKGTIVTIKGSDGTGQTLKADGGEPLGDFPLVVLLNEQTASAAEIVAGALKENDRAVLLGTRSFGKGSVQNIMPLEGGGAIKLTTAYYCLPSGRNLQRIPGEKTWGVDPTDGDYVPLDAKQTEALLEAMRGREILGGKDGAANNDLKVTPATLAKDFADPQLAAALQTLTARLTKGEFTKVGKSHADLLADLARGEPLQRQRALLLKNLEQIQKELNELEKRTGSEGKPPKEKK